MLRRALLFKVPVRFGFTSPVEQLKEPRKFYKNVTVIKNEKNEFEIGLDKRRLKTSLGKPFALQSQGLALAVAEEWNWQKKTVKRDLMDLTSLCNTVIDNPHSFGPNDIIDSCMNFLQTDTLCYRNDEPPELAKFQSQQWDLILKWVENRFKVTVPTTTGLNPLEIGKATSEPIRSYLSQHSLPALFAVQQAVESVKSLVLALVVLNKAVSVVEAAKLARLENNYQTLRWGNVEWHHDIEHHDLVSRLSAAVLYFHFVTKTATKPNC